MPRLFLAVWPPEEVVEELMALPRKDQRGVRFVAPGNWHLTLRFLGEARVGDVVAALDGVHLPEARVRLGPAVDVLAERALVLPAAGLDDLAAAVGERTARIGEPSPRRFAGHLTIARVKSRVPMPKALGLLAAAEFAVEEVALVRSRLEPDGARYETVATWPTVEHLPAAGGAPA